MILRTICKKIDGFFLYIYIFRGQQYFYFNFYAMIISQLVGLVLVLTVLTILDVLVSTNKSSDSYTAFRRYTSTLRHILSWYKYDVKHLKSK